MKNGPSTTVVIRQSFAVLPPFLLVVDFFNSFFPFHCCCRMLLLLLWHSCLQDLSHVTTSHTWQGCWFSQPPLQCVSRSLYFVFVFKNLFKHGSHSANGADFQWVMQLQ